MPSSAAVIVPLLITLLSSSTTMPSLVTMMVPSLVMMLRSSPTMPFQPVMVPLFSTVLSDVTVIPLPFLFLSVSALILPLLMMVKKPLSATMPSSLALIVPAQTSDS